MSPGAKAYIGFIIALGAAAGVRGYLVWDPHDILRFLCYLALAAPASCLKVRLPGVMGTMSVLFVFLLAAIVELGLSETLVISAVSAVTQSYWRAKVRPRLVQIAFSIAVLWLASTAAEFAYVSSAVGWLQGQPAFRLALLASVFFLVNTFPVAAVIALTEDRRLGQLWTDFYSWTFPYYLVGAAVVGTFGFINRTLDWQAWVLILPMVYVIYRSYYLYLDRLENQSRRAEEQRRHAEEVARLLAESVSVNAALRRANEDLEQFAYAASHDLQEPLRGISIYSELLQRRHRNDLSADAQRLLDTITDSAQRINVLVADLLSYTRIASTEIPAVSSTNTAEVLADVQAALAEQISQVGATITVDNIVPLRAHRAHLLQLLQNLLSNSLKYHSPDRRPVIQVACRRISASMAEMTVKDNGIGIDPEYHERVFGMFKRLHSRTVPGTGIGLAICKRIVEYYGGTIRVSSAPGAGSTFHFTLPTGDTPGVTPAKHTAAACGAVSADLRSQSVGERDQIVVDHVVQKARESLRPRDAHPSAAA